MIAECGQLALGVESTLEVVEPTGAEYATLHVLPAIAQQLHGFAMRLRNGGGLHLTGQGTVEVSGSWFTSNAATAEGGGLWCSSTGAMTVVQTSFRSNTAPAGPQAYNAGGSLTINGTVVPPSP